MEIEEKNKKLKEKFPEVEIFEDEDNMLKSIKRTIKKEGDITEVNYEFGVSQ